MNNKISIVTNNVPRDLLLWDELTLKEQEYWDELLSDKSGLSFFRYNGNCEFLGDFTYVDKLLTDSCPEFKGWDGIHPDSFFSGLLVKYPRETNMFHTIVDQEHVIVGRYIG